MQQSGTDITWSLCVKRTTGESPSPVRLEENSSSDSPSLVSEMSQTPLDSVSARSTVAPSALQRSWWPKQMPRVGTPIEAEDLNSEAPLPIQSSQIETL